jgi:DNA mismatch endonuclease (patch repair protein)
MRSDTEGYPSPTSPAVTAVMRGNRRAHTSPERRVRSLLHASGYRFRVDYPIQVPNGSVRPDIVFTRKRVAVFIDGCFWHRCPQHGTSPRANSDYWGPKLDRNVARDRRVDQALRAAGWTVIRIWEHVGAEEAAALIIASLAAAADAPAAPRITGNQQDRSGVASKDAQREPDAQPN